MASWWEDALADATLYGDSDDEGDGPPGANPFLDALEDDESDPDDTTADTSPVPTRPPRPAGLAGRRGGDGLNPFLRAYSVRKSRRRASKPVASTPLLAISEIAEEPEPEPGSGQAEAEAEAGGDSFFAGLLAGLDEAADTLLGSSSGGGGGAQEAEEEDLNPLLIPSPPAAAGSASPRAGGRQPNPFAEVEHDPEVEAVVEVLVSLSAAKASPADTPDVAAALQKARELPDNAPPLRRTLDASMAAGVLSRRTVLNAAWFVDKQLRSLAQAIQSIGIKASANYYQVSFGELADRVGRLFEPISGVLLTAKEKGLVDYEPAALREDGVHDDVVVTLLTDYVPDSDEKAYTLQQVRQCSVRAKRGNTSIRRSKKSRRETLSGRRRAGQAGTEAHTRKPQSVGGPNADAADGRLGRGESRRRARAISKDRDEASAMRTKAKSVRRTDRAHGVVQVLAQIGGTSDAQDDDLSIISAATEADSDAPVLSEPLESRIIQGGLNRKDALITAWWIDTQLRTLIATIKQFGEADAAGRFAVTYGVLHQYTSHLFRPLEGTLLTAKKQGVVAYESDALFKGRHDEVRVILLKDSIPDATEKSYTFAQVRQCSVRARRGASHRR